MQGAATARAAHRNCYPQLSHVGTRYRYVVFCCVGDPAPSAFVHVDLWRFGLAQYSTGQRHRSRAVRAYRRLGLHT